MTDEYYQQLVVGFFVGLGLFLASGANLLTRKNIPAIRWVATLGCILIALGGVWALAEDIASVQKTGIYLVSVVAVCWLAGSNRLALTVSSIATALRRPAVRWGLLAIVGGVAAIGSVAFTESRFERDVDRQMAELDLLTAQPPTTSPVIQATTDRGNYVAIKEAISPRDEADLHAIESLVLLNGSIRDSVIRSEPATDRSNCHGWVFTGGRYWITGTEVDRILTENHYQVVAESQPGDLVVYRAGPNVLHTAIVRYVSAGQPVLVEGKWGCTGVFLHSVDKSIYGTNFKYYRSPREGHILAGLLSPAPNSHAQSDPPMPDIANPDEFTE